jgi:hypothetical protein
MEFVEKDYNPGRDSGMDPTSLGTIFGYTAFPTNLASIKTPEEDNKWQHKTKSARHQNNSTQH